MPALEHLKSIDEAIAEMRRHFEAEQKALSDRLFVAEAETHLAKTQLAAAVEARSKAERIAVKLLTQFGTVAMIFDEAKRLAEEVNKSEPLIPAISTSLEVETKPEKEPE
jgi:hypothetical protein